MQIIDFENHFFTADYLNYLRRRKTPPRETIGKEGPVMWYNDTMGSPRSFEVDNKMLNMGKNRIPEMDENGIEVEVLSLSPPGVQCFNPKTGTSWASKINDELAMIIKAYPNRFIGLACIAPQEPESAAREVARSAVELGLKGIVLHSHASDEYLDSPKYRIIFEKAAKHDMPVYIHPGLPSKLILPGYETYGFELAGPVLGFAADVALHALRLICSGLFDEYPTLQVILGHLGEGLPFWLDRIDLVATTDWKRNKMKISRKPSEYVKSNFTILTSGMHYPPSFMCAYMALGSDRIAFGTDYPYSAFKTGVDFIKKAPISEIEKQKIFYSNAAGLFKI
jgi:5-carboxyvanillate decarboxylase